MTKPDETGPGHSGLYRQGGGKPTRPWDTIWPASCRTPIWTPQTIPGSAKFVHDIAVFIEAAQEKGTCKGDIDPIEAAHCIHIASAGMFRKWIIDSGKFPSGSCDGVVHTVYHQRFRRGKIQGDEDRGLSRPVQGPLRLPILWRLV